MVYPHVTRVSRSRQRNTPWGLTPAEAFALDCACIYARDKDVAAYYGVSVRTVEVNLQRAYRRMGVTGAGSPRVLALRLWLEYHGAIPAERR